MIGSYTHVGIYCRIFTLKPTQHRQGYNKYNEAKTNDMTICKKYCKNNEKKFVH